MALKGFVSYWGLPFFSGIIWLTMLLTMLLYWVIHTHKEIYSTMEPGQNLPYISDIGASDLKPLFIAGSAITTVTLNLSFLAERWLRHRGRLVRNQSTGERIVFYLSILFAFVGMIGLIFLSIFDTFRYPSTHDAFLAVFIAGYLLSAIFICWEYQRLGIKNRDHRILRISFWVKLAFVIVELALAIAFGILLRKKHRTPAAYLEWIIAFIFTLYIWSFIFDLYPAVRTKSPSQRFSKVSPSQMVEDHRGSGGSSNGLVGEENVASSSNGNGVHATNF